MELTKHIDLDSLSTLKNQKLIDHIQTYLNLERPDTNILVKQGEKDVPENLGSYPRFLITYGMVEEQDSAILADNNTPD